MGMDMYLELRKNHKTPNEERKELCSWRKEWDLLEIACPHYISEDMAGKDYKVDKEILIRMLQYLTFNRDYFGTFNTVIDMCEAVYNYEENIANGWEYVINSSW